MNSTNNREYSIDGCMSIKEGDIKEINASNSPACKQGFTTLLPVETKQIPKLKMFIDKKMFNSTVDFSQISTVKIIRIPQIESDKKFEDKKKVSDARKGCVYVKHTLPNEQEATNTTKRKCSTCGKYVSQNGHQTSTRQAGFKPYKCAICGKAFSQNSCLYAHRLVHSGLKAHKCDICGKSFSQRSNLATHQVVHSGEKPHKCDICGKCFSLKRNLSQHQSVHSGLKPFKCNTCGKSFSQKVRLYSHQVVHSGKNRCSCEICVKYLSKKTNLSQHQAMAQD